MDVVETPHAAKAVIRATWTAKVWMRGVISPTMAGPEDRGQEADVTSVRDLPLYGSHGPCGRRWAGGSRQTSAPAPADTRR